MSRLDDTWRKSTHSNVEGSCVEVRQYGSAVQVRDTKQAGAGPTLAFNPERWSAFVARVRKGEFDQ